ncbi:hypothetical protein SAV31267_099950 [Streptomyces avermitilis]|uniref:Uncharacterized protein n=1 Tax=Streptomyces avermitilis TaxID=33903 RepID=A0A4D4N7W1_STRAX|nr:hypothetical protein SAVMC3_88700 [Streptomyces avermitilis]GDY80510.1 hypothetical protein SAV31267_099950 [Streptomyces avermitilis]
MLKPSYAGGRLGRNGRRESEATRALALRRARAERAARQAHTSSSSRLRNGRCIVQAGKGARNLKVQSVAATADFTENADVPRGRG